MSVVVSKSSPAVLRPPEEPVTTTTTGAIKLTSFDWGFVKIPFTALLVFEHLSHEAIVGIKRALSESLLHYYPFAGRISPAADGGGGDELSIRCTGEGAEFVTAYVNYGLKEAKIFDKLSSATNGLLDELAIYYPVGSRSYGSDDPLLSVQVTEFSCGGLVLGVTWNHAVADGAGIAQFLGAVGELARGLPSPSVIPARSDDAVSSLPPLSNPLLHAKLVCPEAPELLVPLDIIVPWKFIDRIKAESCVSFDDGQPCTVFEVVLAVLWRCRVRATMSDADPGTPVHLTFAANMRKHIGAKDGYYGNCTTNQLLAMATSGTVAEAGIVDLIRMIKRAKDQLPEKLKEKDSGSQNQLQGLRRRYDMLHVSSWRNIGFEQVDFGSGAPARVMFHGRGGAPPVPTCVLYPPCKGKDGVNVLSFSVEEEHVDAYLGELAKHT